MNERRVEQRRKGREHVSGGLFSLEFGMQERDRRDRRGAAAAGTEPPNPVYYWPRGGAYEPPLVAPAQPPAAGVEGAIEWVENISLSAEYQRGEICTFPPVTKRQLAQQLTAYAQHVTAEKDRVIGELRQQLADERDKRGGAVGDLEYEVGRVGELERALGRQVGLLERIEQALRSLPEVPPLADTVRKGRVEVAALLGEEGGDGSK